MKEKDFKKKLCFNKKTVSNLDGDAQNDIKGGTSQVIITINKITTETDKIVRISGAISRAFDDVTDAIQDWNDNNTIKYNPPATQSYNRTCIV